MIQYGADVTQATNKGNTPLYTAVFKGYKEVVEVLFKSVSRNKIINYINAKTLSGGNTSLHVASENGSIEITISLLKYGAIYNMEKKDRKTPLQKIKV